MEPFSYNSPGFVNLLASQSSPPKDVDSAEAVGNSPGLVKPLERRKWVVKEDLVLISAWLNTSKDPIVANEQKAGAFWKRIEEYFNSSPQLIGAVPREWSQCKQRWGRVNEQVCKFVGCHEAALKEQTSGQNENDVMKAAHDIFLNDFNVKFALEHCWRELRFDQKWRSHALSKDGGKEKRKEACPEVVADDEKVRPPGVKASKAAKRKKHGNEAAYDQIETMLALKNNISKQKILDRLIGKNEETLYDQEKSLKYKLIGQRVQVTGWSEGVGDEYLRSTTPEDLQRLLDVGEVRGFPGMIGSIDCPKAELFAERQESIRKDVERAFGVLQSRFAIVKNPALLWNKEKIGKIMRTCVILHNMIVENERHGYDQIDTSEFELGESNRSSRVQRRESIHVGDMLGIRREVRDKEKHDRLKADLMENIWQKFGNEN
uniref:Myb-like domain-containing protein n=1 Tax=Brassica oleracea var. oleracea TaxID=109376 RepID=A0A0D3DJB1_BRAOL